MAVEWLKRQLGITELQKKLDILESERTDLEDRVIKAEETRALVRQDVDNAELSAAVKYHFRQFGVEITKRSSDAALVALNAAQAVERYGFKRYAPPHEASQPTQVISLQDLREHPELYLPKLSKGFMNFPVGLNFDGLNEILEGFPSLFCHLNSRDGNFQFTVSSLLSSVGEGVKAAETTLVKATQLSDINRTDTQSWVYITPLDFLANYDGLIGFISENFGLSDRAKEKGMSTLNFVKEIYFTALEIAGTARIRDASELLDYTPERAETSQETALSTELNPEALLEGRIRDSLLSQPKGTSYNEIQGLLPIRSKERFRELASQRTLEILANDKEREGLTRTIGKDLNDYSIGESIVLACYFARNIIKKYKTLEDSVKAVLSGKSQEEVSGKCTDYTGLALHYLREYLVPLHPETVENWMFGFDVDRIEGYNHCYMKIMHINPDKTVDVYFVDPTSLANKGVSALKTPEKIMKSMDPSKLPLLIERDAEDLLHKEIS